MLDASQFKPLREEGSDRVDEWFSGVPDRDVEVIVEGDAERPNAAIVSRANEVIRHLDRLTLKGVAMLQEFFKDKGAWTLVGVGCGSAARRQRCDFLLSFGFEAEGDPWRDTYVYYEVGFVVHERGAQEDRSGRPVKFIVGLH